jgi:type IV pilus biogenesis protein PilP
MAAVGFWASNQMDGSVAELLEVDPGLQDDGSALATAPVIVAPAPDTTDVDTAQTLQTDDETPPPPIVTAIPGRVLSPADAARIYAATGVWQRAPRLPGEPEPVTATTPQGIHSFDVVATVQDIPKPGTPNIEVLDHDLPILTPLNPAPANRPLPRDEDGFIRAAANGTVLPTGVWIFGRAPARQPPLRPTDEPAGLDDASIPTVQEDIVTALQLTAFTGDADFPSARAFIAPALSQPLQVARPSDDAPEWLPATAALISAPAEAPAEAAPLITDDLAAIPQTPSSPTPEQPDASVPATADTAPDQQSPAQTVAALADAPLETPAPAPAEGDLFDAPVGFVEVIQGRPAVVPPLRPGTPEIAPEADVAEAPADEDVVTETPVAEAPVFQDPSLSGFRPQGRPENLLPPSAATFEAIPTLAGFRPTLRPDGLAPAPAEVPEDDQADAVIEDPAVANATDISAIVASIAAAAPPSQIVNPTRSAIVASPRPDPRPRNFARVVSSAQALQQRQQTREAAASTSAAVAQNAPATAPATGGRTTVTVARAATVDNAIRLRDINLIGVYGKPGARRALVRMPNGRFVKVEVGSRLDGGRVTAIGDSALNFVKRGQTYALQLPAG